MLTYRQFLRRRHAIGLTLFNVGSLLFIGLVPLGVGHQVPTTPATGGHGWALRVASIAALLAIASASGSWTFSMTSCAPPLP